MLLRLWLRLEEVVQEEVIQKEVVQEKVLDLQMRCFEQEKVLHWWSWMVNYLSQGLENMRSVIIHLQRPLHLELHKQVSHARSCFSLNHIWASWQHES